MENFKEVYDRNISLVFRISLMYLKNRQDAEDISQDIFLKYLDKMPSFESIEHEKAWFIVATKNKAKDNLKSIWRSRRTDLEEITIEANDVNEDNTTDILDKILNLPRKYKLVIYMYYYETYSIKEISSILSIKESTVQTQLSRGRDILKKELGGMDYARL